MDIVPKSAAQPSAPLMGSERIPPLNQVQRGYRVRFARSPEDLDAIYRLRFEVFNLELGEGLAESYSTGRDTDAFDIQCQHLMVIHEASDRIVGTYRLQVDESARNGIGFYSAAEFELAQLPPAVTHNAIELGRACVAREHRSRNVLFLLWRGLASYVLWNRKRFFFGCSSLTSQDKALGLRTYRYLERRGHVHPEVVVHPTPDFACVADLPCADEEDGVEIPTLFGIYLRYGAKVLGPPAIDRRFGTIDFLTLLDVAQMDPGTFETFAR